MLEKQKRLFCSPTDNTTSSVKPYETWTIFVDGAARGNPGKAGAGIYILDQKKNILLQQGYFLGKKTNNQAEYLALVLASFHLKQLAKEASNIHFSFISDSLLLVKQMQGEYKIKNVTLHKIKTVTIAQLEDHNYSFKHVLRHNNTIADKLANRGIDQHIGLTEELRHFVENNDLPTIP